MQIKFKMSIEKSNTERKDTIINVIFQKVLWCQLTSYLQQDQVDLGAPRLPSDLLGPEEKKEKTCQDFLDITLKPCVTLNQPMHVLYCLVFQHLHHQMPTQSGLSAFVYRFVIQSALEMCFFCAFNLRAPL